MSKYIIDLLQINEGKGYLIGSASDNRIKYTSDVDLEEYNTVKGSLEDILKSFQDKFKKAYKSNNIWITDFKLGQSVNSLPYRWSFNDIMRGYKLINRHEKLTFISQLTKKSIIKMDVIALVNGRLEEYSSNYYFTITKDGKRYDTKIQEHTHETLKKALITDAVLYQNSGNIFKSLKRLYAYYKKTKNEIEQNKLIDLFNSKIGKLYQTVSKLGTVQTMLTQTFRQVAYHVIINELQHIQEELPLKHRHFIDTILEHEYDMEPYINKTMDSITKIVNKEVLKYIKKNPININPISIYIYGS